jgi:hypothetical protein
MRREQREQKPENMLTIIKMGGVKFTLSARAERPPDGFSGVAKEIMGRYGCGLFIAMIDCPLANIRKISETAMDFQEKSDKLKFRMLRRYRKIEVDSRFSAAEDRGRNLNFRHFRHFRGTNCPPVIG